MIPSTGSAELDALGQVAIVLLLLVTIALLIRNRRGR
ncbi:LPXTG cell wall anchor domain-containing protein [Blastococcus xanthinilyticus]|uniref:LPXTG-motif cell wall-anchored protein n=1 Tax=Blastococcus xanthinilyticus TaxID=1564164 RepID=A0A5S5CPX0_9ACTN|nr:LPXTG cell wall anchor domain-containing protein [Blastococcus xanthinilyticus]TYP83698.1 LPXTG-motif cell wall-anchored protein [Blastococcus xanthinilyticus]